MNIKLNIYVISVAYMLFNMVLLFSTPYDVHLAQGADASSWYNPALAILKHGAFVTLNDPTILQTYRPPLYPIYEAFMLFIGNGSIVSIIIGQITLLWLTGLITYKIIENVLPGKGVVGLVLVIFNPNALGTAHLIQSDILYMFMVTATLYFLFLYKSKGSFKLSILIGFLFGLTCLVRTSGQYLILLLPIIYIIIGLFQRIKQPLVIHLYNGLISVIISIVVIFPWAQHNANAGWGYNLTTPEIKVVYFRDNIIYLESIKSDTSLDVASKKVKADEQSHISSYAEKWSHMGKHDKLSSIVTYYKKQLFTYDYNTVAKGFIDSWIDLFGAGRAANLHNLLALDGDRSVHTMSSSKNHVSRANAVFDTLLKSNLAVISISLLSFVYVIALRILGFVGLVKIIRCREYGVLFILSGIIIYFMLIALFVGNSRYRLPIEPALIIMAVYGFNSIVKRR